MKISLEKQTSYDVYNGGTKIEYYLQLNGLCVGYFTDLAKAQEAYDRVKESKIEEVKKKEILMEETIS